MPTISTCLIVKNEASCIERCIKSIQPFSDEIIIYDTGSNDGTQDICRSLDKVTLIQGEWREDFAWARNESFKPAKCDYIMWVDADDVVDEKSQKWLCEFKEQHLAEYDQVNIEYIYDMEENGFYSMHFVRERIFKRKNKPLWHSRIHEYLSADENRSGYRLFTVPFSDAYIMHFKHEGNPMRNIKIYRDMEIKGELNSGRDWFYYARECMWHDDWQIALDKFKITVSRNDLWEIDRLNAYLNMAWLYEVHGLQFEYRECVFKAAACTKELRADVCCELAKIYKSYGNNRYAKALYKLALEQHNNPIVDNTFLTEDKTTIIPALELCVLEYNEGNIDAAIKYNDMALSFEPNNESAVHNKSFFESLQR